MKALGLATILLLAGACSVFEAGVPHIRRISEIRYSVVALTAGVEGTVVVESTLDREGNITAMSVISGPSVFHDSTKRALADWKFELSDTPIRTLQISVTYRIVKSPRDAKGFVFDSPASVTVSAVGPSQINER